MMIPSSYVAHWSMDLSDPVRHTSIEHDRWQALDISFDAAGAASGRHALRSTTLGLVIVLAWSGTVALL